MSSNAGSLMLMVLAVSGCHPFFDGAADSCVFGLNDADEKIAQCDAFFNEQKDVDALDGVVEITGNVRFTAGQRIDDLDPLRSLRRVGGAFSVSAASGRAHSPWVPSLAGLNALMAVEGDFVLRETRLEEVGPFPSLTRIGGTLELHENGRLNSLDGLASVVEIGGDIDLLENDALASIAGLGGVTQIGGTEWSPCDGGTLGALTIVRNPLLVSLNGLEGIQAARAVAIVDDGLESVDGLAGLTSAEALDLYSPLIPAAELRAARARVVVCKAE